MSELVRAVTVRRVGDAGAENGEDHVAVERPLEVRLHGEPFSVIMRTPGADRDLVAGFLFSERVIETHTHLARIDVDADVADVTLARSRMGVLDEVLGSRRQVAMNSSCGMCGRRALESLEVTGRPLTQSWSAAAAVLSLLPARLRGTQPAFDLTGGLHASGLFALDGTIGTSAEDVGRHNAVDKLVGAMLLEGRVPLDRHVLCVSGRSSFEIVQKAFLAGIAVVVAVSAPSSLAIDLADRCGITLIGFARDGHFNVYTHEARVVPG